MGAKLVSYFDQAASIGGLQAKMKLALLTKMASPTAKEVEDSADTIAVFDAAIRQIKLEYGG